MLFKKTISTCILLGSIIFTNAQSVNNPLKKHKHNIKPAFDFDQRFSYINKKSVNIWGYRVGLMVNDKFKVGIGGYYLSDKVNSQRTDSFGNPLSVWNRKMYFGTVYFEPFLIRKKYWETSIVSEIGLGKNNQTKIASATGINSKDINKVFIPAGVGLSLNLKCPEIAHSKIPTWFGLNFMLGYRKSILENKFRTHYDGMYWSIGSAIFVDKAFSDIRNARRAKKAKLN